jgi:hypothetical protein
MRTGTRMAFSNQALLKPRTGRRPATGRVGAPGPTQAQAPTPVTPPAPITPESPVLVRYPEYEPRLLPVLPGVPAPGSLDNRQGLPPRTPLPRSPQKPPPPPGSIPSPPGTYRDLDEWVAAHPEAADKVPRTPPPKPPAPPDTTAAESAARAAAEQASRRRRRKAEAGSLRRSSLPAPTTTQAGIQPRRRAPSLTGS